MKYRKVNVTNVIEYKAKDHPGTVTRTENEICLFHKFTGGYMSTSSAIVETIEGAVYEIPISRMQFIGTELYEGF